MNTTRFEVRTFPSVRELPGISQRTLEGLFEQYKAFALKANEITEKLTRADRASANPIHSELRSLKVELAYAVGGWKSLGLFLAHLGGKGGAPTGPLHDMIVRDYGSFETFLGDFRSSALVARGWVWVAYDHDTGRLMTAVGDTYHAYPVWNATPILAIDVHEHAYWSDHGRDRSRYIQAFLDNLDWRAVEANLETALGLQPAPTR